MIDIKFWILITLAVLVPVALFYFLADRWQRRISSYIQRTDSEEYENHWRQPEKQRAEREFSGNKKYIWDSEKRMFLDPHEVNQQQNSGGAAARIGAGRSRSESSQSGAPSRSSYSTSTENGDVLGKIITGIAIGSALSSSSSNDDCSNSHNSHNSHHSCSSSNAGSSSGYDSSSSSSYDSGGGWDSGGSSSGGGDW